nr:uncharacterized protein LOC778686 [Ciona intestinalis]|eukprot:XP_002122506.1 uncharacterized protein LOC778686 [Ciona intestinalis]
MTLLDVTSPAMTSAPPSLKSNILQHYDVNKTSCDVMPACVTSFNINNEAYKSEFRNGTPDSSPDLDFRFNPKFSFRKSNGEQPMLRHHDVKTDTSSSETSNRNNSNNQVDIESLDEMSRNGSDSGGSPPATVGKRSQPPKKRKLFREAEADVTSDGSAADTSPSAFKPRPPRAANSSEILRQMYAAFGSPGGVAEHLTRFHKNLDESVTNGRSPATDTQQHRHRIQTESSKRSSDENREIKSQSSNPQPPSISYAHKKRRIAHEPNHGSSFHIHDTSRHEKRDVPNESRGFRAYSRKDHYGDSRSSRDDDEPNEILQNNHKNSPSRKRHISQEMKITKRPRGNSPGSPEPQVTNPFMDYYRTNPYSTPYNPLMFHPSLAAFGLPSIPFVPQLPHPGAVGSAPNPLLYSGNPYLPNPLLLREMLTQQSGVASALHGGLSVPPMPQMSLEQLQALQSMPFLTHGMLGGGLYPPNLSQTLNNSYLLGAKDPKTRHQRLTEPHRTPDSYPQSPTNRLSTSQYPKIQKPRAAIPSTSIHSPSITDPRKLSTEESTVQIPVLGDKHYKKSPKDKRDKQLCKTSKLTSNKQAKPDTHKVERRNSEKSKPKPIQERVTTNIPPALPTPSDNETVNPVPVSRPRSPLAIPGLPMHGKPASYKNLTRERRLVANARERTRVHTISSAFDELRTQIPSYSCNQKLSKLAILRIACSYIRTLSVLSGRDETTTFDQGVDQCTRVLQAESRARSRRKTNKAQIEWEMTNYERHNRQTSIDGDVTTKRHKESTEVSRDSCPKTKEPISDRQHVETCSSKSTVAMDDDDVEHIDVTDVDDVVAPNDVFDDVTNKPSRCDVDALQDNVFDPKEKKSECNVSSNE